MDKPGRKRHIPLNLVRPSKRRIRVEHFKAKIEALEQPAVEELDLDTALQQNDSDSNEEPEAIDVTGYDGDLEEQTEGLVASTVNSDRISNRCKTVSHKERKEKLAEKWARVQQGVLKVVIEEMYPPENVTCCKCNVRCEPVVRCTDCGPQHYYCLDCCTRCHTNSLFHHCPEVLKENCYEALEMPSPLIFNRFHNCNSALIERNVICYCISGVPQRIRFGVCSCESGPLTMIRLGYWPATPFRPTIAFSFQLMEWLEALLLECQTAVQDMTQALSYILKTRINKLPCNLYPVLIDSFEEYRHFKRKLKAQTCTASSQSMCPACPKGSGTITVSLDAVFGLCRKESAGKSVKEPTSGTVVFERQSCVDEFVNHYNPKKSSLESNECNNFLAGHALRSKSRYKALDETAVMGTVCRHEVPLRFFSLRHGERISYALFMMKCLKAEFPGHKIQLLYDIACTLHKHLKANDSECLCDFDLAIPVFHCYGHKFQCQIEYSPRNKKGFGLSDGEGMERLWSYLRRFSRMTKEMRPSHRVDVLTDGILYYGQKAISNMGKVMANRMKNAHKLKQEAEKNLNALMSASIESFSRDEVKMWLAERNDKFSQPNTVESNRCVVVATWKEKYVTCIDAYTETRSIVSQKPTDSASATKLSRLEERLSTFEIEHSISSRWLPGTIEYSTVKSLLDSREKHVILEKLQQLVRERWYLLALKAKYADGLSIAARLARRITSLSAQIKGLISRYNLCVVTNESEQLTWENVIKLPYVEPSCELPYRSTSTVPSDVRRQAVDHLTVIFRSSEEIERLMKDMINCVQYYKESIERYESELEKMSNAVIGYNRFAMGSCCLIKKRVHVLRYKLHNLEAIFSNWIAGLNTSQCDSTTIRCAEKHYDSNGSDCDKDPNHDSNVYSQCNESSDNEFHSDEAKEKVDSIRVANTVNTTKTLVDLDTSDTDDEDSIFNPIQRWRGEMFLREEFLNLQCPKNVPELDINETELLNEIIHTDADARPTDTTNAFLSRMKHFTT